MMEDHLIEKNNDLNSMSADDGGSSDLDDGGSFDTEENEDKVTTPLAQYEPPRYDYSALRQRVIQLETADYEIQDIQAYGNCSVMWDEVKTPDYLDEVSQMISPPTVIAEARTDCNLNLGTARHTEPISVHGERKSWSQKMDFEWIFVITNIVLEFMSAIFTQLSSKQKPQYALFGMLLSYLALLTCIIELIYEGHCHQQIPIWRRRRGAWYYDRPQRGRSFATLNNIFALVCALGQCVVTTINYRFENPIKPTVSPIILAFGVLFSKILKYRQLEAL